MDTGALILGLAVVLGGHDGHHPDIHHVSIHRAMAATKTPLKIAITPDAKTTRPVGPGSGSGFVSPIAQRASRRVWQGYGSPHSRQRPFHQ